MSRANISLLNEHTTIVRNEAIAGGAIFASESQLMFASGNRKLVGIKQTTVEQYMPEKANWL